MDHQTSHSDDTNLRCMRNQPLAIHEKIGVLQNVVDVGVDFGNEIPTEVGQLFDSLLPVLTPGFATSKYN